ncbi:hypothetical protein KQI61_15340 [Anaerocolumna aminovalerica]|uniref:hypothetical protein n=1 Tax=Anaerocolumna aminovalerica TaxID=1527 RepID=UPI001C0EA51A|nr:hypothetical protein [Anaerocolumna aminovalerica]MBU5333572.1 hypothetical protein [Anaerocolumna aminovalerica]
MPFFDNTPRATFKLDLKRNKYVPVIASFDTEGHCKPLYFRYTYPDGSSEKVAIDRVEKSENSSLFGINYYCVITINEMQMMVVLYYGKEDNKWALRL